jgi:hypothetical protein
MPWRVWRWPLYARRFRRHLIESRRQVEEARKESRETIKPLADVTMRLTAASDLLQEALEQSAVSIEDEDNA